MAAYRDPDEMAPSRSMTSSAITNIGEHGHPHRRPHTAMEDQVRRCEIEQIMQTDPRRYWSNAELQRELFSLLEGAQ
jgi:hypothetical protein